MSELQSLLFYIFFFILSTLIYYLYNKFDKKIFLVLSFIIPMFIGGLRYCVGTDYITYLDLYNYNSSVDFGFSIISKFAHLLGNSQWLFFIYNFLTIFFIYLGLENIDKKYRTCALFCYFFLTFTASFNIMRQYLAVSIIFFAYKYLKDKNIVMWIVFILVASCFHNTAILCFPFYFVVNSKSKKIQFLFLVLIVFLSFNYINILRFLTSYPFFSHYIIYLNEYADSINNKMFYLDLIILLYILFFRKKLLSNDKNNYLYLFLYIISIVLSLTGFSSPYVKRIGTYFILSRIILLSNIPFVCKNEKNKILNIIIISVYVIGTFTISTYLLKQGNVIPYRFIGG